MFDKESFKVELSKIPFMKETIEGLGECGIRLFRDGEFDEISKKTASEQIAMCLIDANGKRLIEDNEVDELVQKGISGVAKSNILGKILEVNGYKVTQKEVKKN
jgi:hypothetical protein